MFKCTTALIALHVNRNFSSCKDDVISSLSVLSSDGSGADGSGALRVVSSQSHSSHSSSVLAVEINTPSLVENRESSIQIVECTISGEAVAEAEAKSKDGAEAEDGAGAEADSEADTKAET